MKPSAHKALAIGVISFVAFMMPASAAAQAITNTTQVLPPGGTGCPVLPINAIVPHVSNGALHSFDVTLANSSYVALLAQVGGEGIPFNYITRFSYGSGVVRHHVDVQTTPIRGAVTVSLILLSSPPGSPTCLSTISFGVSPTGTVLAPGATTGTMGTPVKPPAQSSPSTGVTSKPGTTAGASTTTSGTKGTVTATSATSTVRSPVDTGLAARLQSMCAGNNSLQLWFLLLAVYVVIAALTALARPPLAQRALWIPLVLILVPLVLLLGLWYFVPSCRAAGWVPAVSVIIAIAALLVAFRDQNPSVKVIPLPAAKPKDAPKPAASASAPKAATPALQSTQRSLPKGK